jgi:ABC-type antimicrobial peptide transport system permease subunit
MLELLGIKMEEGRTFSQKFGDETSKIIINETGIAVMGLKNPVGKKFNLWGNNYEIIGVAKDFNFRSLHEKVKPFFFRFIPGKAEKIMIKIAAGRGTETITEIQNLYKSFNPGYSFEYQFLDDDYQKQYVAEQRVSVMSEYFAGLAILISCLGLFGLAAFTAERRQKEIGIRKVFGSGEVGIVKLLSGEFTSTVIMAIFIAIPISYVIANLWLERFAYSIDLKWWYFAGAGMVTVLIAWFTVGFQTLKSALLNPVEALRSE